VESVCGNTAALLKYSTLVTDVHASVLANVSKACILAVSSALPKFKPVTVTDPLPLSPIFTPPDDMTGPSKVNIKEDVPTMDPTVTVDSTSSPAPVWARHDTVLTDTHDRHAHIVVPKDDVAVKSWLPKLRPSTLTQYPPEVGALADENDVTGASKLKNAVFVPTGLPIQSREELSILEDGDSRARTVVADVH